MWKVKGVIKKKPRRKPKNASVGVRREEQEINGLTEGRNNGMKRRKKEKRNRTVKGRDKIMGNCAR